MIKNVYESPAADITLLVRNAKPAHKDQKRGEAVSHHALSVSLEVLADTVRREKEIKSVHIEGKT